MKGKAITELTKTGMPWRIIGWGGAVALLAIPFVAMGFTSEVNWSPGDFILMGGLLALIGGAYELAVKASGSNRNYRAGAALALLATFLVIWANLAVGIVGSEDNLTNWWFFGALLVGTVGACVARVRAGGMAIAMTATGVSLWIAFAVAVARPTDEPFVSHWVELAGTTIFAVLFLASAALFHRAAGQSSSSS